MKIGILTIGQSPRTDIVPELIGAIGSKVKIEEKGALDGLTLEEVEKLSPETGDHILVTRMKNGKEVIIAKQHIVRRIKQHLIIFNKSDVDVIILLCTGEFTEEFPSNKLIIKPNILMEKIVSSLIQNGEITVIVPSIDQALQMEQKWKRFNQNLKINIEAISPYTGTKEYISEVGKRIAQTNSRLIILDCLGFNKKIKQIIIEITGKPVLLPRTLLGRVVGELVGK